MKSKKLVGINTYCEHSHNINKGKYVYASNVYKDMSRALQCQFVNHELIVEKTFDNKNF